MSSQWDGRTPQKTSVRCQIRLYPPYGDTDFSAKKRMNQTFNPSASSNNRQYAHPPQGDITILSEYHCCVKRISNSISLRASTNRQPAGDYPQRQSGAIEIAPEGRSAGRPPAWALESNEAAPQTDELSAPQRAQNSLRFLVFIYRKLTPLPRDRRRGPSTKYRTNARIGPSAICAFVASFVDGPTPADDFPPCSLEMTVAHWQTAPQFIG